VAAVAGQERARRGDEHRAGDRQPDDEVPRGVVRPQPVLGLVHDAEEERGDECRREADHRAHHHEAHVLAAGDGRRGLLG